jgi:hypothetical protein
MILEGRQTGKHGHDSRRWENQETLFPRHVSRRWAKQETLFPIAMFPEGGQTRKCRFLDIQFP